MEDPDTEEDPAMEEGLATEEDLDIMEDITEEAMEETPTIITMEIKVATVTVNLVKKKIQGAWKLVARHAELSLVAAAYAIC